MKNAARSAGLGVFLFALSASAVTTAEASSLAAGGTHTALVRPDGTVWTWGANTAGQLGDGSTVGKSNPGLISGTAMPVKFAVAGGTQWSSVAAGSAHTVAVRADGSVWTWGANTRGQLGNGTLTSANAPVWVRTLGSVTRIAAGSQHTLALRTDGVLTAWGYNSRGQLGNGTNTGSSVPSWVDNNDGVAWTAVAAGRLHSAALKSDGSLWTWGNNLLGQLGVGSGTSMAKSPMRVGSDHDWRAVAAGSEHTVALKSDGTLYGWGLNRQGEIGIGNTEKRLWYPTRIGTASNWSAITAGKAHTAALKADGTLWTWGDNSRGQLGRATPAAADRLSPGQVGAGNQWIAVAAGDYHTVAMKSDGTVWAWGANTFGQLGDGTVVDRPTPVWAWTDVTWSRLAVGRMHSIALRPDGTLWAWGTNDLGQIGDGTSTNRTTPVPVAPDRTWRAASAGDGHSAAISADGTLWTWGNNTTGQLGDGTTAISRTPKSVGSQSNWVAVSAGSLHTVALKSDGTIWSWGGNLYGQLGRSTDPTGIGTEPMPVGSDSDWIATAAGGSHTYALKSDGSLWGWGQATRLGIGFTAGTTPAPVRIGDDARWAAVAAGHAHTVALKSDGTLWTWGDNSAGQLCRSTAAVSGLYPGQAGDRRWLAVSAGRLHTAAIGTDGVLWVCGSNTTGQLGNGSTADQSSLVAISPGLKWMQVVAGGMHTLGLGADGTLWTWGAAPSSPTSSRVPLRFITPTMRIGAGIRWSAIASGYQHTVARRSDGTLWGWGDDMAGGPNSGPHPSRIGAGTQWAAVYAGAHQSYGRKSDGTLWGWGVAGELGSLGTNTGEPGGSSVAAQVGAGSTWLTAASGSGHTLALASDRSLWGWGDDRWHQLECVQSAAVPVPLHSGYPGGTTWRTSAAGTFHSLGIRDNGILLASGANGSGRLGFECAHVFCYRQQVGTGQDWVMVEGGDAHSVALKSNGTLWAWGENRQGQLGDGTTNSRTPPAQVGSARDWVAVAAGHAHTVALKADGTLWTWGDNSAGQLGRATTAPASGLAPGQVAGDHRWIAIAANGFQTAALRSDGSIWAWGQNTDGQLGDGTRVSRALPVPVSKPENH